MWIPCPQGSGQMCKRSQLKWQSDAGQWIEQCKLSSVFALELLGNSQLGLRPHLNAVLSRKRKRCCGNILYVNVVLQVVDMSSCHVHMYYTYRTLRTWPTECSGIHLCTTDTEIGGTDTGGVQVHSVSVQNSFICMWYMYLCTCVVYTWHIHTCMCM